MPTYISSKKPQYDSLGYVVEAFLMRCRLEGFSELTVDYHTYKLGRFVEYCSNCSLGDITPAVVKGFLADAQARYGLDIMTVHGHLKSVKVLFNWLVNEGLIGFSPCQGVKVGKLPQRVVRGLTARQQKLLMDELAGDNSVFGCRNRAIVMVLLDCGLRVSELVNLRVGDVDVKEGIIRVFGKGSKERLVRMGRVTRLALAEYLRVRSSQISWLWVNKAGHKQDVSGVQQWLRKLGARTGIRLYPHLLRHTFAISFLRNGGSVFALQCALGHSNLEMTKRYCQALGFEDVFREHELASPVDRLAFEDKASSYQVE